MEGLVDSERFDKNRDPIPRLQVSRFVHVSCRSGCR